MYLRRLAMLDVWRVYDGSSERRTNALVAKADTQDGDVHFVDKPGVEPEIGLFLGSPGARREDNCVQGWQDVGFEVVPVRSSFSQVM